MQRDVPGFKGEGKEGETTRDVTRDVFQQRKLDAKEHITPRLLLDENLQYQTAKSLQETNPSWYQKLTDEQKEHIRAYVNVNIDEIDHDTIKYYTVKEVLRKVGVDGANLRAIVGDPTQFGERETILGGGFPLTKSALSHVEEAYNTSHSLKVYDTQVMRLPPFIEHELQQKELLHNVEFHWGESLASLGKVHNHDIIIPHPGYIWGGGTLSSDLSSTLGPGSKAYILTDTLKGQKDLIVSKLQEISSLNVKITPAGDGEEGEHTIKLGGVPIETTQPGPYYIIEVEQSQ